MTTLPRTRKVAEGLAANLRNPAPNSAEAHASEHGLSSPAVVPPNPREEAGEIAHPKKYPLSKESVLALVVMVVIGLHLVLGYPVILSRSYYEIPILAALILGGLPLVYELALKAPAWSYILKWSGHKAWKQIAMTFGIVGSG